MQGPVPVAQRTQRVTHVPCPQIGYTVDEQIGSEHKHYDKRQCEQSAPYECTMRARAQKPSGNSAKMNKVAISGDGMGQG